MNITVYRPNMDFVAEEARKIRLNAKNFEDRDLNFYDWKQNKADHVFRILPPWSAKGFVFKKVFAHYNIPPDKAFLNCAKTWPDTFDDCFLCQSIDKIQALFPEADLGRQRSGLNYYANVIDRDAEEAGVQICRFTPKVYNWIQLQMDDVRIGDVTDYENGYDVKVTKVMKKMGDRAPRPDYTPSFIPKPCPLHEKEEVVAAWLSTLYDLDRVYRPLTEEELLESKKLASTMLTYYQRRFQSGPIPGLSVVDDDGGDESLQASEPAQPSRSADPPRGAPSPQSGDREAAKGLERLNPQELPLCHASLGAPRAHADGSYGFKPDEEMCLLCPYEVACMDAKATKGI